MSFSKMMRTTDGRFIGPLAEERTENKKRFCKLKVLQLH